MKTTTIFLLAFLCMMPIENSFSQGELKQIIGQKKEENQSTVKKRRKKVHMCHECGKPETECDCEGEGHGVKEDHKDH